MPRFKVWGAVSAKSFLLHLEADTWEHALALASAAFMDQSYPLTPELERIGLEDAVIDSISVEEDGQ